MYDVFISKSYFPIELRPRGIGKEAFEQWRVNASSRKDAADKVWDKHGNRLLSLMTPRTSSLPRKISLHVSGTNGTAPGRLTPVPVDTTWEGTSFRYPAHNPVKQNRYRVTVEVEARNAQEARRIVESSSDKLSNPSKSFAFERLNYASPQGQPAYQLYRSFGAKFSKADTVFGEQAVQGWRDFYTRKGWVEVAPPRA
jgi:hypothetical protein